jgi:hypothetical protein
MAAILQRDELALETVHVADMPRNESRILSLIDGRRASRDVIATSHMSSFDACRVIVQLLEARLVRRKHVDAGS